MDDKEYTKEKIGLLKTEMNLLWSSFFVTFGSSLAICLNRTVEWHLIFAIIGFFLSLIFLNAFVMKRDEALKLIKFLKGEK